MSSEEIEYSLAVNIEDAKTSVQQVERLMFRTLGLFRRMGLPENVDHAVMYLQRFISAARMARISLAALEAASGPIGWALAAITVENLPS